MQHLYDEDLVKFTKRETQGGHLLVSFLMNAMYGEYPRFSPVHQLSAARLLTDIGSKESRAYIQLYTPPRPKRRSPSADAANAADAPEYAPSAQTGLDPKLAAIIAQETDGGKTAVRFLIDVMEDNFVDFRAKDRFTPWQRISAARELIRVGFIRRADPKDRAHAKPSDAMRYRPQNPKPPTSPSDDGYTPATSDEKKRMIERRREANRANPKLSRPDIRRQLVEARVIEPHPNALNSPVIRMRLEKEAEERSIAIADAYAGHRTLDAPLLPEDDSPQSQPQDIQPQAAPDYNPAPVIDAPADPSAARPNPEPAPDRADPISDIHDNDADYDRDDADPVDPDPDRDYADCECGCADPIYDLDDDNDPDRDDPDQGCGCADPVSDLDDDNDADCGCDFGDPDCDPDDPECACADPYDDDPDPDASPQRPRWTYTPMIIDAVKRIEARRASARPLNAFYCNVIDEESPPPEDLP